MPVIRAGNAYHIYFRIIKNAPKIRFRFDFRAEFGLDLFCALSKNDRIRIAKCGYFNVFKMLEAINRTPPASIHAEKRYANAVVRTKNAFRHNDRCRHPGGNGASGRFQKKNCAIVHFYFQS